MVSAEARATVLVAVVDLEEEADLAVEVVASVVEGALEETLSVEVEAVASAETAIILETTTAPELLVADSGALVITNLAAEEEPMLSEGMRVRRSSSRLPFTSPWPGPSSDLGARGSAGSGPRAGPTSPWGTPTTTTRG